jgi:hypothetical protein
MWAGAIRPAGQPGCRQSYLAGGTSRKTLSPQLEALEDRLTPVSFNFFPIAHVAVNAQPLPPSVAIEIDSMPNLAALSAGTSTQEGHVAGVLSKQIALEPGAPTTSAATANYRLELIYKLNASVTQTAVLPSSFADGSVRGTVGLAGTFEGTLAPVAPTTGATWVLQNRSVHRFGPGNHHHARRQHARSHPNRKGFGNVHHCRVGRMISRPDALPRPALAGAQGPPWIEIATTV